jgi:RNA polymerase sigma-70 factor, ECF subfamily
MSDAATHYLEAPETPWWRKDCSVAQDPAGTEDRLLEQLILRVKERDSRALENLIAHTSRRAFGLAYHLIGDYHRAQDILQEAYLRLYRHIHTLKNPRAFHGWFAQIITNLSRDCFREKTHYEVPHEAPEVPREGTSSLADRAIAMEQVREALGRLTPVERTTLLLREYYELSYDEVARVLNIPLGTVKSRLAEARKRLADIMVKGGTVK